MTSLERESELYRKLSYVYDNNGVSKESFFESIDIAGDYSRREMKYVIFHLKWFQEEADTGMELADIIIDTTNKILDTLTMKRLKRAFIIEVLESAISECDEKNNIIV